MGEVTYRQLRMDECERIREIDASQFIHRAWREADGVKQLVEINYQDPDFPEGYEHHLAALKKTIERHGSAIGAFENKALIGFCSINPELFGEISKYVLLDQLFISLPHRRKGIGKKLFYLSVHEAKQWGAEKFYICAGSSEETLAFYFSIGCVEATEINQELYDHDHRDVQLEYDFSKEES